MAFELLFQSDQAAKLNEREGSAMRAVLLLFAVVAEIATSSVANAQGPGCSAVLNHINQVAELIEQSATTYWAHRAHFVDLIYGPSSQVVPNAVQVAEQEKSAADVEKQAMPGRVNSLKGLLTAFYAQDCDPSLLLVTFEPAMKHGKRVNFDQFPPERELEEQAGPGPTRMPRLAAGPPGMPQTAARGGK